MVVGGGGKRLQATAEQTMVVSRGDDNRHQRPLIGEVYGKDTEMTLHCPVATGNLTHNLATLQSLFNRDSARFKAQRFRRT